MRFKVHQDGVEMFFEDDEYLISLAVCELLIKESTTQEARDTFCGLRILDQNSFPPITGNKKCP